METLTLGLTTKQIKALVTFYEKETGRRAADILSTDIEAAPNRERQLRYILGIMKNRFFLYSVETQGLTLLTDASNAGVSIENLRLYATSCSSWTQFREKIESLMSAKVTEQ